MPARADTNGDAIGPAAAAPAPFWARARFGDALSAAAGIGFLAVGMILPLVGKSGAVAPFADRNRRTFEAVLAATLLLALGAAASKILRRRRDGGPAPRATLALVSVCVLLWIALRSGALAY